MKRLLAFLCAVLIVAVMQLVPAEANQQKSAPIGGSVSYHASAEDTLYGGESDTIKALIGACKQIHVLLEWKGDSTDVIAATSVDGNKWYHVAALSDTLIGYDSVGVYYSKVIHTGDDSSGVTAPSVYSFLRMILRNGAAVLPDTADSVWANRVSDFKGVIECAR